MKHHKADNGGRLSPKRSPEPNESKPRPSLSPLNSIRKLLHAPRLPEEPLKPLRQLFHLPGGHANDESGQKKTLSQIDPEQLLDSEIFSKLDADEKAKLEFLICREMDMALGDESFED
jgi:hypothetical protein